MRHTIYFLLLLILPPSVVSAQQAQRFVAVTIDDLPVVSLQTDLKTRQEITRKLLAQITAARVPAIGFVNENKLYTNAKRDEAEIDLLRAWLDAGLEIGNHTFSHIGFYSHSLKEYEDNILRGEIVIKELMQAKNKQIRYFRHPFLITGKTMINKRKLAKFLAEHGYTIAPVTFDTDDYMFARVYDIALSRNDQDLQARVGASYLPYLESKIDYWERQSVKIFGREPKQILLLHANSINAEYLNDVFALLKKRNYQFVTLEDALTDEVYKLPDTFTKRFGISWLHRWAFDKGKSYFLPNDPAVPAFVAEEYEKAAAN